MCFRQGLPKFSIDDVDLPFLIGLILLSLCAVCLKGCHFLCFHIHAEALSLQLVSEYGLDICFLSSSVFNRSLPVRGEYSLFHMRC
jgi:hypothetical protein